MLINVFPYIERCTEIEKSNRILLEKMTNIMTSNPITGATANPINKPVKIIQAAP